MKKKSLGYNVVSEEDKANALTQKENQNVVQLGEPLGRPEKITGSTYKVKTPVTEHALYITINDIIMNEGTPQEHRRPFEIFINSKKYGSLPMDCRFDACHVCCIQKRWRFDILGRRAS